MRQFVQNLSLIAFAFVLLFLFLKITGPLPFSVNSVSTQKTDTFNVTGEGKVSIKPDVATVTVGISVSAPTVKEAQDQINANINKVSQGIKSLGISDKDIQTTNYNINPNYDYKTSIQQITGYSANTNLLIKVRNLDNVNSVLDTATKMGANQVGGVNFDVDDKTKAENEARAKAVANAKTKAIDAAKIAGFRLGKIVNYQENSNDFPRPVSMLFSAMEAKTTAPTQVEPGSTDITITVTLSYEIN